MRSRTGEYFAWQKYGVKPDVLTSAKALTCGVPAGAFMMTEKVGTHSLVAGDHGTTYGGNPLAGAAVVEVIRQYEERNINGHVKEVGAYLWDKLEAVKNAHADVVDHRGAGLLQGLEFDHPVADIINKALDKGLVLINAGTNIIIWADYSNTSSKAEYKQAHSFHA